MVNCGLCGVAVVCGIIEKPMLPGFGRGAVKSISPGRPGDNALTPNQLPGVFPADKPLKSGISLVAEEKLAIADGEDPWLKIICDVGETSLDPVRRIPFVDLVAE